MKRTNCRSCNSKRLTSIMDLGNCALAGGFLDNAHEMMEEKEYPLEVFMCEDCGLIQILEVVDPDILFKDYCFKSSTVKPLVTHFEKYAKWLQEKINPSVVVDIGANDGILLKPLEDLGITACGVDISENVTEMGRQEGRDLITGYFDDETAKTIIEKHGKVDVVTMSNAFPHNDRPDIILETAKKVLKDDGYFCLEVMYLGDLLEQLQWDTWYHEHLSFYCLNTLKTLLNSYGFKIVDAERIPMHGGSLRVMAQYTDRDITPLTGMQDILKYEEESGLVDINTWKAFSGKIKKQLDITGKTLKALSDSGASIWAYGAAGKATMLLNACNMDYLEAIVDSSPLRADKYMPGVHTPIVFPKELDKRNPDYVLCTAWNYIEQIKAQHPNYKGIWIVPLPTLTFS